MRYCLCALLRRFRELVDYGYFNDCKLYRVVPGFIVQWGIPKEPADYQKFGEDKIRDDPVKKTNAKGTLTFATSGPNARGSQIFVNLDDNDSLDDQGFSPFGMVTEERMLGAFVRCTEAKQKLDQAAAKQQGNAYFEKMAPELSYIKSAKII